LPVGSFRNLRATIEAAAQPAQFAGGFVLPVGSFRNLRVTIEAAAQPAQLAGGFVLPVGSFRNLRVTIEAAAQPAQLAGGFVSYFFKLEIAIGEGRSAEDKRMVTRLLDWRRGMAGGSVGQTGESAIRRDAGLLRKMGCTPRARDYLPFNMRPFSKTTTRVGAISRTSRFKSLAGFRYGFAENFASAPLRTKMSEGW